MRIELLIVGDELLTGQTAFQGDSPVSTMSAILRDTPEYVREPPSAVPPALAVPPASYPAFHQHAPGGGLPV